MKEFYGIGLLCIILFMGNPVHAQADKHTIHTLVDQLNTLTLTNSAPTENLTEEFLAVSDTGKNNDAVLMEVNLATLLSADWVHNFLAKQLPDGSWPDIDYHDQKRSRWEPAFHVTRIQALAKVYQSKESTYYHNADLLKSLKEAIDFWINAHLVCPNWWYNEIGCPKLLGPALLLLKDELTAEQKHALAQRMGRPVFQMTGQNKVWLAGNQVMKGLLLDSLELVQRARDSIFSELYVSLNEGLQPDYSFHQHGPQMQFGNYGLAYASTLSYWLSVFSGTELQAPSEKVLTLRNYLVNGLLKTIYGGYMDTNALGRQVFQHAQRGKALALVMTCRYMMRLDPAYKHYYQAYITQCLAEKTDSNEPLSFSFFPRSDFGIYRSSSLYASIRMYSNRTTGYEMTNDENLQGQYAADGTLLTRTVGNTYDDIFPVWNWKYLPGVTCPDDGLPLHKQAVPYLPNHSDFVGGLSVGTAGIAAISLYKDSLQAKKAYFFLDGTITCLGAAIHSTKTTPIHTTLDQTFLSGSLWLDRRQVNVQQPYREKKTIHWLLHDQLACYFFRPTPVHISAEEHNGSWRSIAPFYTDTPVRAQVLTAWIDHGVKPRQQSYAYMVVPNVTPNEMATFASKPTVHLLQNDSCAQVIQSDKAQAVAGVFYQTATVTQGTRKLIVETPGLFLLKQDEQDLQITVCDPTQQLTVFKLRIEGKLTGEGAVFNPESHTTDIVIPLPLKPGEKGKSVSRQYR
ncbi:polysaccharide lyase 8 family protein [Olivibacter ginsenosidimutans]|uniref:Polysaccharide lyase 8 family protein n=1 Tax=Olivibacter ginsenosidimutans TaxID=1176537 RepID=A0ABP9BY19_9SPHI